MSAVGRNGCRARKTAKDDWVDLKQGSGEFANDPVEIAGSASVLCPCPLSSA